MDQSHSTKAVNKQDVGIPISFDHNASKHSHEDDEIYLAIDCADVCNSEPFTGYD